MAIVALAIQLSVVANVALAIQFALAVVAFVAPVVPANYLALITLAIQLAGPIS